MSLPGVGGWGVPVWEGLMNKFEQVSSDGHQMWLARGGVRPGGDSVPWSHVLGGGCTVKSNASWVMVTRAPNLVERQQHTCENITFQQLARRAVISEIPSTLRSYYSQLTFNKNHLGYHRDQLRKRVIRDRSRFNSPRTNVPQNSPKIPAYPEEYYFQVPISVLNNTDMRIASQIRHGSVSSPKLD